MNNSKSDLLKSLKDVDWASAARTYGNNHSTLIGMIVQWWIKGNPEGRHVLEGAPSVQYLLEETEVRGHADAMLCENQKPLGVIEVEGTKYVSTATKIGGYFGAEKYQNIKFGILLLYVTGTKGKGENKKYESSKIPLALEEVKKVTAAHPDKPIVVITLDKELLSKEDRMFDNKFFGGRTSRVAGSLYLNGEQVDEQIYFG